MRTKSEAIREAMAAVDWRLAISLAARLPQLDRDEEAIKRAQGCLTNPGFYCQLGFDPAACVEAGKAALRRRFPSEDELQQARRRRAAQKDK